MKVFSQLINEVLNPEQKKKVDSWDAPHHSFSDHMFEKPTDTRAYFELESPEEDTATRTQVSEHLKKNSIDIDDYVGGTGKDRYGRKVKLGKALRSTNAPLNLINSFENDGARQQKGKDLMLAISRHPHDVAGMTSEGQSWENESCMNFSSGSERQYLKQDVRHGTHVAYLIHRDDKNIERPLARVALKPFHDADDESNETILRPEDRVYGNARDSFTHTINRVLSTHFPGTGYLYNKNEHLYDDDKNSLFVSDIDRGLKSPDPEIRRAAIANKAATPKHIAKALMDTDYAVKTQAAEHPAIEERQLLDIINNKYGNDNIGWDNSSLHQTAIKHSKMPQEMLGRILKNAGWTRDHRKAAASNPNMSEEHLKIALNDPISDVQEAAARNPSLKGAGLSAALSSDKPVSVRYAALHNKNITHNHITELLDSDTGSGRLLKQVAYHHPLRTNQHIMRGLSDSDEDNRASVFDKAHGLTPDHIEIGLNDKSSEVRNRAAANKAASYEQIERAIADPRTIRGAMDNPNLTHDQISKGLASKDWSVQLAAIRHHNVTPEHIDDVLSMPSEKFNASSELTQEAIQHPNADSANIHKALMHDDYHVRVLALRHSNATRDHARRLVNDRTV
jgi:hypothetical protein